MAPARQTFRHTRRRARHIQRPSTAITARTTFADPMDDNGHGTHCAGIIGAEGDNGDRHRRHQLEGQDHAAQVPRPRRFRLDQRRDRGDQLRDRPQEERRQRPHHQRKLGLDSQIRRRSKTRSVPPARPAFCLSRPPATTARTTTDARITRRITICQTSSASPLSTAATTSPLLEFWRTRRFTSPRRARTFSRPGSTTATAKPRARRWRRRTSRASPR